MSIHFSTLSYPTQSALMVAAEKVKADNLWYYEEQTQDGKLRIHRTVIGSTVHLYFTFARTNAPGIKNTIVFDPSTNKYLQNIPPQCRTRYNLKKLGIWDGDIDVASTLVLHTNVGKKEVFQPLDQQTSESIIATIMDKCDISAELTMKQDLYSIFSNSTEFKLHVVCEREQISASFINKPKKGAWDERPVAFPCKIGRHFTGTIKTLRPYFEPAAAAAGASDAGAGASEASGSVSASAAGGAGVIAGGWFSGRADYVSFDDMVLSSRVSIMETIRQMQLSSVTWSKTITLVNDDKAVFVRTVGTTSKFHTINVFLQRDAHQTRIVFPVDCERSIPMLPASIMSELNIYSCSIKSECAPDPRVFYTASLQDKWNFTELSSEDSKRVERHINIACTKTGTAFCFALFDPFCSFVLNQDKCLRVSIARKNGDDERLLCCGFAPPDGFSIMAFPVAKQVIEAKQAAGAVDNRPASPKGKAVATRGIERPVAPEGGAVAPAQPVAAPTAAPPAQPVAAPEGGAAPQPMVAPAAAPAQPLAAPAAAPVQPLAVPKAAAPTRGAKRAATEGGAVAPQPVKRAAVSKEVAALANTSSGTVQRDRATTTRSVAQNCSVIDVLVAAAARLEIMPVAAPSVQVAAVAPQVAPVVDAVVAPQAAPESVVDAAAAPQPAQEPAADSVVAPQPAQEPVVDAVVAPQPAQEPAADSVVAPQAAQVPVVDAVVAPQAAQVPVVDAVVIDLLEEDSPAADDGADARRQAKVARRAAKASAEGGAGAGAAKDDDAAVVDLTDD